MDDNEGNTAMDKANFHEPLAIMQPHMYWTDAQKASDIDNYPYICRLNNFKQIFPVTHGSQ